MPVLPRRADEIGEPVEELERQGVDDASGPWPGGLPPTTPPDPELIGVERVPGVVGSAIDCRGGVVLVPDDPRLSLTEAFSLDRPGRVNPSHLDLTIGGFAVASAVNFQGLFKPLTTAFVEPTMPGNPLGKNHPGQHRADLAARQARRVILHAWPVR